MLKKYVIEMEEITTCDVCPFTKWDEDNNTTWCSHPLVEQYFEVQEHLFAETKHPDCLLKEAT